MQIENGRKGLLASLTTDTSADYINKPEPKPFTPGTTKMIQFKDVFMDEDEDEDAIHDSHDDNDILQNSGHMHRSTYEPDKFGSKKKKLKSAKARRHVSFDDDDKHQSDKHQGIKSHQKDEQDNIKYRKRGRRWRNKSKHGLDNNNESSSPSSSTLLHPSFTSSPGCKDRQICMFIILLIGAVLLLLVTCIWSLSKHLPLAELIPYSLSFSLSYQGTLYSDAVDHGWNLQLPISPAAVREEEEEEEYSSSSTGPSSSSSSSLVPSRIRRLSLKPISSTSSIGPSSSSSSSSSSRTGSIPTLSIPNIVHFTVSLSARESLYYYQYLNIMTAFHILKPYRLYLHYYHQPRGIWWEKLADTSGIIPVQMEAEFTHVHGQQIHNPLHRHDVAGLMILYRYGGFLLSTDTLVLRNIEEMPDFLKSDHEEVGRLPEIDNDKHGDCIILGRQGHFQVAVVSSPSSPSSSSSSRGPSSSSPSVSMKHDSYGIGNSFIIAPQFAPFLDRWFDSYHDYKSASHNRHSMVIPKELAHVHPQEVVLLNEGIFFPFAWTKDDLDLLYSPLRALMETDDKNNNSNNNNKKNKNKNGKYNNNREGKEEKEEEEAGWYKYREELLKGRLQSSYAMRLWSQKPRVKRRLQSLKPSDVAQAFNLLSSPSSSSSTAGPSSSSSSSSSFSTSTSTTTTGPSLSSPSPSPSSSFSSSSSSSSFQSCSYLYILASTLRAHLSPTSIQKLVPTTLY